MSSGGRAASSSGCAIGPKGHETGLTGSAGKIRISFPTGSYAMATAEHREPCESRGSCTVLAAPRGEIPPGDSPPRAIPDGSQARQKQLNYRTRSLQRSGVLCRANSGPEHSQQSMCAESLLDHLIGAGEQRGGNGEAKRFCSLQINNQLELRCLIDRNVPR